MLTALGARVPALGGCLPDVERAARLLVATFEGGGTLLVCGNGGSAADAEHVVGELMKGFRSPRPLAEAERRAFEAGAPDGAYLAERLQGALPAISLASQTALLTAIGNDLAFDLVFAQQVHGYGRPGDALLALSTSGRSRDVLLALQVARVRGLRTVGLTGPDGGAMDGACTVAIRVPGADVAEVQEHHQAVYHALCAVLEDALFGTGAATAGGERGA